MAIGSRVAAVIGRLRGIVTQEEEGTVVVDVNGVGYEVLVPLGTFGRAEKDDDGRTTLFVHTHVREDVLSLFGFATDADRIAFRTLIGVSSVGPKTAIGILSALPAGELARAVAGKEIGKFTAISGVGKKTAERLLLELRDKLPSDTILEAPRAKTAAAKELHGNAERLVSALVKMGYKPQEAERAVSQLGERTESESLSALVKEALALLAK